MTEMSSSSELIMMIQRLLLEVFRQAEIKNSSANIFQP